MAQSTKPLPHEDERTAYHEAAHNIAARIVRPDGGVLDATSKAMDGTLGHVALRLSDAELNGEPQAMRPLIIVALAGKAAEIELLGVPDELTEVGASNDEYQVQYFLDLMGLAGEEREQERLALYRQACELVVRERDAIEHEAQRMLREMEQPESAL